MLSNRNAENEGGILPRLDKVSTCTEVFRSQYVSRNNTIGKIEA
jgi:hypothetical protein